MKIFIMIFFIALKTGNLFSAAKSDTELAANPPLSGAQNVFNALSKAVESYDFIKEDRKRKAVKATQEGNLESLYSCYNKAQKERTEGKDKKIQDLTAQKASLEEQILEKQSNLEKEAQALEESEKRKQNAEGNSTLILNFLAANVDKLSDGSLRSLLDQLQPNTFEHSTLESLLSKK